MGLISPLTSANPGAQGALGVPEKRLWCPTVGPLRNTSNTHTHIDLQLLCEGIAIYKTFYPILAFSKWESPVQLVPVCVKISDASGSFLGKVSLSKWC